MQKIQLGGQNAPRFKAACDDACDDGTHLFTLFPWIEFRGILEFYTFAKRRDCVDLQYISSNNRYNWEDKCCIYDDETQSHISKEVLVDWFPLSRGNRAHFESCWKNEIVLFGYFWNQLDSPVHNPYNVFLSILFFFLAFSPFLASVAAFVGVGSRLVGFDPNWHWQRGR